MAGNQPGAKTKRGPGHSGIRVGVFPRAEIPFGNFPRGGRGPKFVGYPKICPGDRAG